MVLENDDFKKANYCNNVVVWYGYIEQWAP